MEHGSGTHTIFNQTPPLTDYNLFATDMALQEAVQREGAAWALSELTLAGAELGTCTLFEHARLANRFTPVLHNFDARGMRIDSIEFHPSWHALMRGIAARGYHSSPWAQDSARPGAHAARAAGYLMQAQIESGTLCPTTMTYGAIAAMRRDAWLAREWVPRLLNREYDARDVAFEKTRAGLSCFFMPRRLPDGSLNGIYIQRLKDKLGNRSNASSEVEFVDAWASLLGEEGRGVPTILEMGTFTRLDCCTGSAGMMRQAVVQALHHAHHRKAFGSLLIEQPLMRSVLVDLALESEAACALSLRLARAFDSDSLSEIALRRVLTSAAKFWVCKRGCELAAECMEVLGGNGYTEELPLARMAREMPVNSIWEGSGNIMCLDVLRAFAKSPATRTAVLDEISLARGQEPHFDAAFERFAARIETAAMTEAHARRFAHSYVILMQANFLLAGAANSPARAAAEGFCATRLGDQGWGAVFGASDAQVDNAAILGRAWNQG